MSNDEREEERDFLEGLKARTGRDLGQWMAAIAAAGFSDKNEIIDWLRAEGLPFARASWLERIHRNGGKPIYATALPAASAAEGTARGDTQPAAPVPRPEPALQARHAGFNAISQKGEAELVFLGDSITQGWEGAGKQVWEQKWAPLKAANFGIGGPNDPPLATSMVYALGAGLSGLTLSGGATQLVFTPITSGPLAGNYVWTGF